MVLEELEDFHVPQSSIPFECAGENPVCEHCSDGSLLLHVAFEYFMRTVPMIWHISVKFVLCSNRACFAI